MTRTNRAANWASAICILLGIKALYAAVTGEGMAWPLLVDIGAAYIICTFVWWADRQLRRLNK